MNHFLTESPSLTTMKSSLRSLLIPFALGSALSSAVAQTSVSSDPIGFNKVTLKGDSDTVISIPFHQKSSFTGKLSSDPQDVGSQDVEAGEDAVLTVTGAGWTASAFLGGHYVRFTSGVKNGFYYEINGNTDSTIEVNANGDDLSGIVSNDSFKVIPHWTLDLLFPDGAGINVSTSSFIRQSEIFFVSSSLGINKSAEETYYYLGSTANQWRKVGGGVTDQGGKIIYPNQAFIVRNNLTPDTEICADGVVPLGLHAIQLDIGTGKNDNYLSFDRPVPVSLNDSGLVVQDENTGVVTGGVFEVSTSTFLKKDELFVFDNTLVQKNKPASAVYFFFEDSVTPANSSWRRVGGGTADVGDNLILEPGHAIVIRKAAGTSESTAFGLNSATY